MLKNLKYFIPFLALVFILSSCDKIEPPYFKDRTGGGGEPTEVFVKKVLLEEYTGHHCVNCPTAAKIAHDLVDLYDGRVLMLSVHAGWFANPSGAPFDADYRTEAGEEWNSSFGVTMYPMGLINRISAGGGSFTVPPTNWGSKITEIIDNEPEVGLTISNEYNSANRKLEVEIKGTFLQMMDGDYRLLACIVEDNLVSAQKNNDPNAGETPVIQEYVHRHVLRETINGIWGDEALSNPNLDDNFTLNYSLTLKSNYDEENCSILAFVYDYASKEIIQVEEKKIK